MRHFFKSLTYSDYICFIVCGVAYLLLLLQSYFVSCDDFALKFHQGSELPINSIADLISSNIYHYSHANGRFLVHCCVQYCLNHYVCFHLGSTLMFTLLLMSLTYLVRFSSDSKNGEITYILVALFAFVPLMATLFYGTVAMTINYMWSAAVYTFFISIYLHIKEHNVEYKVWQNIILLIFGIICGSWQESFGIGIAAALCIYHLFTIKNTRGSLLFILIGFGIGSAILVFAPSNFSRASAGDSVFELQAFIYRLIQIIVKNNVFSVFWIILGLLSIALDLYKTHKIKFVSANWLYFTSGTIAFAFTLFTIAMDVYQGEWQMTILSVWSVIILIRFINYYFEKLLNTTSKYLIPILILLLVGFYSYLYYYRSIMKKEMNRFTIEFVQNKPDTIYDGNLHKTFTCDIPNHEFVFEKICPMYLNWFDLETLNRMALFYTNAQEMWGSEILPEPIDSIASRCTENNIIYHTPLNYMVVRTPKDSATDNLTLNIYVTSKYPIDKMKDMLNGRNEKIIGHSLSNLLSINKDEYTYYVMYLDWWRFHNRQITFFELVEK